MLAVVVAATLLSNGWRAETIACREEPYCATAVVLQRADALQRMGFGPADPLAPASLDVFPTALADVSIAIAGFAGGSDAHFEIAVLDTSSPSRVRELTAKRIEATTQDALFVGTFGGRRGILVLHFLWEDEAHYAPHRYRATVYAWNGERFEQASARETARKHESAHAAARELGYVCERDFLQRAVAQHDY
ncbi:MAG TPA: hypothetical protein VHW00_24100 [Thermoanaerobaculia bacterium]|nr:hypothetical protein [Thermoanaerobaculia bacterium]